MSKFFLVLSKGEIDSALALFDTCYPQEIINEKDSDAWTALHWACHHGSAELVELLIKNGANINSQTIQGFSPLYVAVRQERLHLVFFFT